MESKADLRDGISMHVLYCMLTQSTDLAKGELFCIVCWTQRADLTKGEISFQERLVNKLI